MFFWSRKNSNGTTSYGLAYRDATGRKCRETFLGVRHERVARLIFAERLARVERRAANLPEQPTASVSAILSRFVASREHMAPHYVAGLRIHQRFVCETIDADKPFRDLSRADLAAVIAAERNRGRAVRTINGRLVLLSAAGKLAVADGLIAVNPCEHPPLLTDRRPPVWRRIDDLDYAAILSTLRNDLQPSLLPLVVFLANTGARLGEALALTWDDVGSDSIRLTTAKGARGGARAVTRIVGTNATLAPVLASLSRSEQPFPWNPRTACHRWHRAQTLAGLPRHYRLHDLRHTFASRLADAGTPPYILQRLLGHASLTTTLRYYHAGGDQLALATLLLDPQRNLDASGACESPIGIGD